MDRLSTARNVAIVARDRRGRVLPARRRARGEHVRSRAVGGVRRRHRLLGLRLYREHRVRPARPRRPPPRAAVRRRRASACSPGRRAARMWETGFGELVWFVLCSASRVRADRGLPPLAQLLIALVAPAAAPPSLPARAAPTAPILAQMAASEAQSTTARRARASPSSAARCPTSPACTCSATARPRHLRRQGQVGAQARRVALLQGPGAEQPRPRRDGRERRADRVRRRRLRGRGAAGRAELHQAVPPALQHPPARRQVLPVHRDLARRGLPARLLHARAPPLRARVLRPVLERQARARDARGAREGVHVPLLHRPRAGPAQRQPVPRLLHQALRGAVRRLRLQGGLPRAASTA